MSSCKHRSALQIAASELIDKGLLRTFEAVYRWTCPDCGGPRRTTRLADTIYALRHAYGWVIETQHEGDLLAVYTLTKAGDMPGEDNGPHPRRLVRDWAPKTSPAQGHNPVVDAAVEGIWLCTNCGAAFDERQMPTLPGAKRLIGGYWQARCTSEVCKGKTYRVFRAA